MAAVEKSRPGVNRRRTVRVPASSANLGPGFDVMGAALDLHMEVDVVETGALRRPHRPQDRPRPPQPDRARVRRAAPARRLRVHDPLGHPALRRARDERGGDRRRPRRGRLDLRARRRRAGARRRGSRAIRTTSRRRCWAGSCCAATATRSASTRRPASSACWSCPEQAVRTPKAREALPSRIPVADAVFNIAHASLLVLGLARGDLGLVARGLGDRIHQPRRAHLYPRSWELVQSAKRPRRARGDDLRRRPDRARLVRHGVHRRRPRAPARGRRGLGGGPPRAVHAHRRRRPLAVIVLLHGFMDSPRTWDLVRPYLGERRRCSRRRCPGHLGGPPLNGRLRPRRRMSSAVMDEAGVERAHLVGNSLGGYLALRAGHARARRDGRRARARPAAATTRRRSTGRSAASPLGATSRTRELPRATSLLAPRRRASRACDTAPLIANAREHGWPLDPSKVRCPVRVLWGTGGPAAAVAGRRGALPALARRRVDRARRRRPRAAAGHPARDGSADLGLHGPRGSRRAAGLRRRPSRGSRRPTGRARRPASAARSRSTRSPSRPGEAARIACSSVSSPGLPSVSSRTTSGARRGQRGERGLGGVRLADVLDVVVLGQPEGHEARERLRVIAVEDADSHDRLSV